MPRTVEFTIEQGDITAYDADVVVLKYARNFYGADKAVANALGRRNIANVEMQPPVGKYRLVETNGSIKAPYALFYGVPPLRNFRYQEIFQFVIDSLSALADEHSDARRVAMTIHGGGYGLDEAEACLSQWAGCVEAVSKGQIPQALERISFVEILEDRAERFRNTIDTNIAKNADQPAKASGHWGYLIPVPTPDSKQRAATDDVSTQAGALSEAKPHAFIAMPFKTEMEDVFYYGIQQPVHTAGMLCERVDKSAFTGGIMEYVRDRIETASVVIAELSGANPNVYLEVGYAWGKGRPTILLVKDEKELHFDVQGQRCLTYGTIKQLEGYLHRELKEMVSKGIVKL